MSSFTSEPCSKCQLAPEWQSQRWSLSSKENLRRAAPIGPSKAGLQHSRIGVPVPWSKVTKCLTPVHWVTISWMSQLPEITYGVEKTMNRKLLQGIVSELDGWWRAEVATKEQKAKTD